MTNYEPLTLLLSIIATVISLVSLVRTRRMQEEQLKLERITAELSQRQLDRMTLEAEESKKADVRVTLERNRNDFRFRIRNEGKAKAKDVWVTLDSEGSDNPLVGSEYKNKIPIPFLSPDDEAFLIAAIHIGSSGKYTLSARWINEDGSQSRKEFFLSV